MIEKYKCTSKNGEKCLGYKNNGECNSLENCGYKKEIITNFERIKAMSVEETAIDRVVLSKLESGLYLTSDGEIWADFQLAIQREILWLKSEVIK